MNSLQPDYSALMKRQDRDTLAVFFRECAETLRNAGAETPELDARLLICHALGLTHEDFAASPEREVELADMTQCEALLERRRAGEPVARILGRREFFGLDFEIGPHTLDPRPDTETLVEAALELLHEKSQRRPVSILDLGTGSGCILVSLLHELGNASGIGTDISAGALEIAARNAARHGVADRARFIRASWADGIESRFDLVVSNPPYIATRDMTELAPEVVRHDPRAALDGGADGLAAYREIVPNAAGLLRPGGWIMLEVGAGQHRDVYELLATDAELALRDIRDWQDLSGSVRCLAGQHSPMPEK